MRSTLGFTLIELLIVVMAVALLAAITLPNATGCNRGLFRCQANLRLLWQSKFDYAQPYGGHQPQIGSVATGKGFWLEQQRRARPVLDGYEPYVCPLTDDVPEPGRGSYRGPATNVNKLRPGDPCGADKEGNHGEGRGGNVLMKTGEVVNVAKSDPLWIWAGETTKE